MGWPELPLTAQGLGQLMGERPCRVSLPLSPRPTFSEGFRPNQQPLCATSSRQERGPPLALLAITDLQFPLLKEQGLGTEFTLNGAEGVSLLYVKRNLF